MLTLTSRNGQIYQYPFLTGLWLFYLKCGKIERVFVRDVENSLVYVS